MRYLLWPEDSGSAAELGNKARALAELEAARLPIPPWFVLTPAAFYESLSFAQRQSVEERDVVAAGIAMRGEIRLAPEPLYELETAITRLCPQGELLAIRPSAAAGADEELQAEGQFDSFLFVPATIEATTDRIAAVWRSAFSQRAIAFREQHGVTDLPCPPSILVQRMVNADRAGVAFGADPVSGRRGTAVVAAVWGLGTSLAAGESAADTYHLDRTGAIVERDVALKRTAHCAAPDLPGGVAAVSVPDGEAARPALTDSQVSAAAELARRAGRLSGGPREIEWAIEAGSLFLIASRPVAALQSMSDPDGERIEWDRGDLEDSFGGVTTPLSYSWARRAYAAGSRLMARELGVSAAVAGARADLFERQLGLIRGRVYYNVVARYRAIELLPAFAANRGFLELLFGVTDPAANCGSANRSEAEDTVSWLDRARVAQTLTRLGLNYLLLPSRILAFRRDLDTAAAGTGPSIETLRIDELAALYRSVTARILAHGDLPLMSRLFARLLLSALGRMTRRWCGDLDGSICRVLSLPQGRSITAQALSAFGDLAAAVRDDTDLASRLRTGTRIAIARAIAERPGFASLYYAFLSKHGDQITADLRLERRDLHDDPLPLFRALGRLIQAGTAAAPADPDPLRAVPGEAARPGVVSGTVTGAVASTIDPTRTAGVPALRRPLFEWLRRAAARQAREAERLLCDQFRIAGVVRRLTVEIGKRLASDGALRDPRDIFYLEESEILGYVAGTAASTDLMGLVELRREEYSGYSMEASPPERFETRGVVPVAARAATDRPAPTGAVPWDTLHGVSIRGGSVQARAAIINDSRTMDVAAGCVLVAERPDPGLILLIPAAAALLIENASLSSRVAALAREVGIPTIVGIPGLFRRVTDGEMIDVDGSAGTVRRPVASGGTGRTMRLEMENREAGAAADSTPTSASGEALMTQDFSVSAVVSAAHSGRGAVPDPVGDLASESPLAPSHSPGPDAGEDAPVTPERPAELGRDRQ